MPCWMPCWMHVIFFPLPVNLLHHDTTSNTTPFQPIQDASHHISSPPLTHKFSHLSRLHLLQTSPMQLLGLRQLPPTASQPTNQPANPEPPSLPRLCPVSMPILLHLANSTSLLTSSYAKADAAPKARLRHGTDIPPSGIPPVPCPACPSLRLPSPRSLPPTSPRLSFGPSCVYVHVLCPLTVSLPVTLPLIWGHADGWAHSNTDMLFLEKTTWLEPDKTWLTPTKTQDTCNVPSPPLVRTHSPPKTQRHKYPAQPGNPTILFVPH